jgi:hypothetical protein
MVRKIGIYNGRFGYDEHQFHSLKVKLKPGIKPNIDDIITDDMIEELKDPLWYKLVSVINWNRNKNNGEMADAILDLINTK